jgi:hypothetical protein
MSGAIPPFHQYVFMGWCLVKAQGQLCLYFNAFADGIRDRDHVIMVTKHHRCFPERTVLERFPLYSNLRPLCANPSVVVFIAIIKDSSYKRV